MEIVQYQQYLETLPFPALLSRPEDSDPSSHRILYLNPAFVLELGYELTDIPDKRHWWQQAYPDPAYRKVVASQWELESELARERGDNSVSMEALITNKAGEEARYKVITSSQGKEPRSPYQVFFIRLD